MKGRQSVDEWHDAVLDNAAVLVPVLPVLQLAAMAIPPIPVHCTEGQQVIVQVDRLVSSFLHTQHANII